MDVERLLWPTFGSAIGGALRYATSQLAIALLGSAFPYATLAVNLLGSFLIGLINVVARVAGCLAAGVAGLVLGRALVGA